MGIKIQKYRLHSLTAMLMIFIQHTISQPLADSLVLRAMNDELNRNFHELRESDTIKPFFISYTVANVSNTVVSATLGAINSSTRQHYKDWQVRVMVGDYDINDENFTYNQAEELIFQPRIEMPVDNDYAGIRRSLWLTTNDVFQSATRTYKNKRALIDHKQLDESLLEIPDFSRSPVVDIKIIDSTEVYVPTSAIEEKARKLSLLFNSFPEIYNSGITFSLFESTVYFINSEGTRVQFPCNIVSLTVQAGTMSDDSERLNRILTYIGKSMLELPSEEALKKDVLQLIDNLLALKNAERFEDEYTGPILMIGETAAESLEKFLFSGSDALIAFRETLESTNQMNMYYEYNDNSLQSKINKLAVSKDMTVTALPFMKEYNNIPLLGHFDVDAEGVVPPEKLVLIENGVIKTLLNGRTPSRYVPASNGHMRFDYNFRGLTNQVGPGVIMITSNTTRTIDQLKKDLLSKASEMGLDYAIIIRSLDVGGSNKPYNYFKVSVADGSEVMIRSARMKNLTLQALRRSPRFSDHMMVHNCLLSTDSNGKGLSGIPSSFILPDAILLEEIELESFRKPLTSMLPIIENPVGIDKHDQKSINEYEE